MSRRRELLAAGVVRDFRFKDQNELDIHLYGLKKKEIRYKVLEQVTERGGTILARILQEHGTAQLIELYED